MTAEELVELLHQTGAIMEGHFLLSSGLHSDRYVQCARLLQYPDYAERAGRFLVHRLDELGLQWPDLVASPAIGGIVIGQEVARALGVRHIFVEKDDEGNPTLRRGFFVEEDENVLVVEDVVTTGKSSKEVIRLVSGLGGNVVAVAAIVDRTSGRRNVFGAIPFVAGVKLDLKTFKPEDCPLCHAGKPLKKPGSRKF